MAEGDRAWQEQEEVGCEPTEGEGEKAKRKLIMLTFILMMKNYNFCLLYQIPPMAYKC